MPFRVLGLVIIFSLFIFGFSNTNAQENPNFETETIAQYVVHIVATTPNGVSREGSGVIVSSDGIIFTAQHVVENAAEIRIEMFDRLEAAPIFQYYARPQYTSSIDNFDFAILEIIASEQGQVTPSSLNLSYSQAWNRNVVVRENIQIFGYPESANGVLHVTAGIIGNVQEQPIDAQRRSIFFQTDAIAGSGSSGGLVINSHNEFIGIPIDWEDDQGGYVVTILPVSTICEIEPIACDYEPSPPLPTGLTQNLVNSIFGAGNWFCFPHTLHDIGARDFDRPFVVSYPIQHIEYWNVYYTEGQEVPGHGGATVALQDVLVRTECPASQISALNEWDRMRASYPTPTRSLIDNVLGQGNWQCPPSGSVMSVMLTNPVVDLSIQYPFIGLDSDYIKYGVGDTIPFMDQGTLWLRNALPREDCP